MKDDVFQRWWPLPSSMDLVRAPIERAADILQQEWQRTIGMAVSGTWVRYPNIDAVFRSVPTLTNVPRTFVLLPTRSAWSVLWNNSLLCDGYDSLCHNISRLHGVDTLAWRSSDTDGPLQAGTRFAFRRGDAGDAPPRTVYCCRVDRRWAWQASGPPLPEEDTRVYQRRQRKQRLDERVLMELMARLGAQPWRERFYRLRQTPCFRLEAQANEPTLISRPTSEVLSGGGTPPAQLAYAVACALREANPRPLC